MYPCMNTVARVAMQHPQWTHPVLFFIFLFHAVRVRDRPSREGDPPTPPTSVLCTAMRWQAARPERGGVDGLHEPMAARPRLLDFQQREVASLATVRYHSGVTGGRREGGGRGAG